MDALARMKGSFKALALLDPAISDAELSRLRETGFTGFRIKSDGKGGLTFVDARKMAERVKGFGWHVEFMSQSLTEALEAAPILKSLNMPYVFDHLAHTDPKDYGSGQFEKLLRILKAEELAWINLYSFYQRSREGPPRYSDMLPIVRAICETRNDCVIWGSNWPHAGIAVPTPNDADLLDFLLDAVPEENDRRPILSENPAKLYGWPTS